MKLSAEQLARHLPKQLAPIYWVSGDEPLQVMEACDAIRARARDSGCNERLVFNVETGFDWGTLSAARDTLSLFAEQRLLEVRLPSAKPGEQGAKALVEYAARPPADDVLLVSSGKLDKATQRTKWFAAVERAGVMVQVWPLEPARLPAWIAARLRAQGLQPDQEAAQLLAERVEGNLLAAVQEIEKLVLLHEPGPLDAAAVAAAVADSARYSVYDLADRALAGEAAAVARILNGLRGEGAELTLLLWALTREIRALAQMAAAVRSGTSQERVFAAHRVWDKRKPLVKAALQRHRPAAWQGLLRRAGQVDRLIKGQRPGNAWDELLQLALALAGVAVLPAAMTV